MAVKLYGWSRSPFVSRALLCLEEAGVDYELVPMNKEAGDHRRPDHLARNVPPLCNLLIIIIYPTRPPVPSSIYLCIHGSLTWPVRALPPAVRAGAGSRGWRPHHLWYINSLHFYFEIKECPHLNKISDF
jgi:hypothetical protein